MRLLIFLLLIFAGNSWAQQCPQEFEQLNQSCIQSIAAEKFTSKKIYVNSELKDNVYFYQTAGGELGKMRIIAITQNKDECSISLEAVTYSSKGSFIPNSSIAITRNSHWVRERIYLDKDAMSGLDLEIPRAKFATTEEEEKIIEKEKADRKKRGEPEPKEVCTIAFTKDVKFALYKKMSTVSAKKEAVLLLYAPLALIFVAIFLVVRVFMEEQDKFKTQEALEEVENVNKGKKQALFIKITKPFYKRYFLPMVQGFKNKQVIKTKYRQKLANAGLLKELTPEEFMAMKLFMIIGGPATYLAVRWFMDEQWPLSITPLMGLVGYFVPDFWLSNLISKRKEEILRGMPFIVDMLALSVEAGLDFMAAIQKVIDKAPESPLVDEFQTLIRETKIGSSRAEGLRQLGWRVNTIEINSFCATLIAADSVGASIGPILKQLSNELRVKRSARAEQAGATAATKILIPMIFFILPAVLVAIFAPMVLKMMTGGGL